MSNVNVTQNSKEGKNMLGKAFNLFLDQIIIENHTDKINYWSLFASDLSHYDKKTFLTYLIDADTFEDFTENPTREREAIKEYEDEMQYFINERIDDLYHEIQYELSGR